MRNAYYDQQYQLSVSEQDAAKSMRTLRRQMRESFSHSLHALISTPRGPVISPFTATPLSAVRSLNGRTLKQANPSPQSPPPTGIATGSGDNTSLETASQRRQDSVLMDAFFADIRVDLSTYASAQCAEGYTGRLCAMCSPGYGSYGIATCKACTRLNLLYYSLVMLLTLCFLAWTFYSSLSYARKPYQTAALGMKKENGELSAVFLHSKVGLGLNTVMDPDSASSNNLQDSSKQHSNPLFGFRRPRAAEGMLADRGSTDRPGATLAWQHSTVGSPFSLASTGPGLQWGMLPTPFAVGYSLDAADDIILQADSGSSASPLEIHANSPLLISQSAPSGTEPTAPAASQPALHRVGDTAILAQTHDAGYPATSRQRSSVDVQTRAAASDAPHSPNQGTKRLLGKSTSSPPRTASSNDATSIYSEGQRIVPFWTSGSQSAADCEITSATQSNERPSTLAGGSHASGFTNTNSGSKEQSPLVVSGGVRQDSDVLQADGFRTEEDPLEVWLDKDGSPTVIAHIRRIPAKPASCDGSEQDSSIDLEARSSFFADTRDPVIVDSNRAAMVVTRIFLSYLQVRNGEAMVVYWSAVIYYRNDIVVAP